MVLAVCLPLSACGNERQEIRTDENRDTISAQETKEQNVDVVEESVTNDLSKDTNSDVLEIREKMFLTQINDIYYNFDAYQDKTIIVEGMYTLLYAWDGSKRIPGVYRKGPGCCGNDGWGGFFLKYDGVLPQENDWIRVSGVPELEEGESFITLYLNVTSMEVKEERGAEFVMQ